MRARLGFLCGGWGGGYCSSGFQSTVPAREGARRLQRPRGSHGALIRMERAETEA